jgi:uncharacterized protein
MSGGRIYDGFVPGRFPIDAYGNGGFRFADMSHRGSILALPSGIRAWDVTSAAELSEETLAPVFEEGDALELLLLGMGAEVGSVSPSLRSRLREARIRLEIMQTGAAARTFNVLVAENRKVGAALIAVE